MNNIACRTLCLVVAGCLIPLSVLSQPDDVNIDGAFADWADEVLAPDDSCIDFSGQQEARGAAIATNFNDLQPATVGYFRFDFDITSLMGMNSADGCWLIDGNGSGSVNAALCFSLQGSPLAMNLPDTSLFTCNDASASNCGGPTQVASTLSCAAAQVSGVDRLNQTCADAQDTAVECSIDLADIGYAGGGVTLLGACASTSAQPNSSTFDCVFDVSAGDPAWTFDPINGGGGTPVMLQRFDIQ